MDELTFNKTRQAISHLPLTEEAKLNLLTRLQELHLENKGECQKFLDGIDVLKGWIDWMKVKDKMIEYRMHYDDLLSNEKENILAYLAELKETEDQGKLDSLRQQINQV